MEYGTSPVVQWLRICLPVQGHGFDPWSRKSPHAEDATKPAPQLLSLHNCSPYSTTRQATRMRSLHALTREYPLLAATREKHACSNEDPAQPKKRKNK